MAGVAQGAGNLVCRQGEQTDVSPDKKKVVFKKLVEKDIETRRNKIKVRSLCKCLIKNHHIPGAAWL